MTLVHRLIISCLCLGYCLNGFEFSDIRCLNGPDFWCLNSTTESLCNFTNKTIGVCGYSNKRCEVETGKNKISIMEFSLIILLFKVTVSVNHRHHIHHSISMVV